LADTTATLSGGPSRNGAPFTPRRGALALAFLVLLGAIGFIFAEALVELERLWSRREEYSHGYLIPLISLLLVWQKRDELAKLDFRGS
jgi:hypothetical protein